MSDLQVLEMNQVQLSHILDNNFNEFGILLISQHKHDVTFSNCPTYSPNPNPNPNPNPHSSTPGCVELVPSCSQVQVRQWDSLAFPSQPTEVSPFALWQAACPHPGLWTRPPTFGVAALTPHSAHALSP